MSRNDIIVIRDDPATRIAELEMQNAALQQLLEKKELTIANLIQENASLQKKALHDPLTGAYNRWMLEEEILQYDELARRSEYVVFGIFLIDLDKLKLLNDIFGHSVGDNALVSIVRAIGRAKRKADMLFRCGGDEFAMLALLKNKITMDAARQHASSMAHRIEFEISQEKLQGCKTISISASIGFHLVEKNKTLDPTTLLKLADRSLYDRKRKKKAT